MRRIAMIVTIGAFVAGALTAQSEANDDQRNGTKEWDTVVEILPLPFLAFAASNSEDQITVVRGFNLGIGYTAKHYFDPVQTEQFNGYWSWGTTALVIPHVFIGGDYQTESGFYVGGGGGIFYLIPFVYLGLGFFF